MRLQTEQIINPPEDSDLDFARWCGSLTEELNLRNTTNELTEKEARMLFDTGLEPAQVVTSLLGPIGLKWTG